MGKSPEISWSEAVARLARERTIAETFVGLLKRHGSAAAIARGALAYGEAKAEYDAIIAGLTVALASKAATNGLRDLETMLHHAFKKREAFCNNVKPLVPGPTTGEKGVDVKVDIGIGVLIDAIRAIWLRTRDESALIRKTIQTQLEAVTWPDFTGVKPGP